MASLSSNWRTRYERRWKTFEKAKETAISRGYKLPSEVTSIQHARGGYRQAYEKLGRYDLKSIQRKAIAEQKQEERKSFKEQEKVAKKWGLTGTALEKQLSKALEKKESRYVEEVDLSMLRRDEERKPIINEDVMPAKEVRENMLIEVNRMVSNFQNKYLAYRVQDLLKLAANNLGGIGKLEEALASKKEDVIEELQKDTDLQYTGNFAMGDESTAGQALERWYNMLDAFNYTDEVRMAEAEGEVELEE